MGRALRSVAFHAKHLCPSDVKGQRDEKEFSRGGVKGAVDP